jgi:hypothetical protein
MDFERFSRRHHIIYFPFRARVCRINFAYQILLFECKPRMRPALLGKFDYVNHKLLLSEPDINTGVDNRRVQHGPFPVVVYAAIPAIIIPQTMQTAPQRRPATLLTRAAPAAILFLLS